MYDDVILAWLGSAVRSGRKFYGVCILFDVMIACVRSNRESKFSHVPRFYYIALKYLDGDVD